MKALCLLLAVFAASASAAEYFVSPHGDDAAAGNTVAAPFATIGKGVSALKAGDTLTILPGEYVEAVTTDVSGTAEAPVTIRAQRAGTVVMRGDVVVTGFVPVEGLRRVFAAEFKQRVESVAERGSLRTLDPRLTLAELEMSPASYFHDEKAGRLYVRTSDSRPPDEHGIAVAVTNACGLAFTGKNGIQHVVIDGLALTGFHHRDYSVQHGSRTRWGLYFRDAQNVTVRRCTAWLNSGGIGLLGGGEGCVVEDCTAYANESRHIDIANNILGWGVGGTTFRRNRVEGHSPGSTSKHDIAFYSGRDGCMMEDNLALNGGLMIKGDLKDAIQRGNVVIGKKFYRDPDATNLELLHLKDEKLATTYADPLQGDFRLQKGAEATAVPHAADGAVFYVSPTGSDAAAGESIGAPWATLSHAAKQARPGDTIYLLPGVYAESLAPATSGTAQKKVIFARHGHGHVVLDGGGEREIGIDLSGREHVEVRGVSVRGFTRFGVFAKGGDGLRVSHCTIAAGGGDAAAFGIVKNLAFAHNLLRQGSGVGLRLRECSAAEVMGNLFSESSGTHLTADSATLGSLWSDRNAFASGASLGLLDAQNLAQLADWQSRTRLDPRSIALANAKLDTTDPHGVIALKADSPLLGAGPLGQVIGPFLRLTETIAAPVTDIAVRGVAATTATLEWWLPLAAGESVLDWGDTPACANRIELAPAAYHNASLAGLKPGSTYHFRISPRRNAEQLRFATAAPAAAAPQIRPTPTEVQSLTTATAAPAPRTFHVAKTGADTHDGLTPATAWASISHAATEARAGDTVLVHGGDYEEYILVRSTGDAGAPLTFRAAPGEIVWLTGSQRTRHTAFHVPGKNHIIIEGFRFREFNALDGGQVVRFEGGDGHIVRRCFFDGRVLSGYVNSFLGAGGTRSILVENNVIIGGMGEALGFSRCASVTVRHNVIYIPSIRAVTCQAWDTAGQFHFDHNIIFDTLPAKTNNPLVRLMDLENLRSGHNCWFTRTGPEQRSLLEPMRIGDKDVWQAKPGSRIGQKLLHADVIKLTGQDKTSRFANPGLPVLATLYQPGKETYAHRDWLLAEMHLREDNTFAPLTFEDFLPTTPLLAEDGKPIGLDPAAVR